MFFNIVHKIDLYKYIYILKTVIKYREVNLYFDYWSKYTNKIRGAPTALRPFRPIGIIY